MPQVSKKEMHRIQNGLYASVPTRSSVSEINSSTASGHTYKFNSIDSYLKFNDYLRQESSPVKMPMRVPIPMDINASVIGQGSTSSSNQRPEKRVRSKKRRETVSSTSARDSDIAALGDLEEFFVVTNATHRPEIYKGTKKWKKYKKYCFRCFEWSEQRKTLSQTKYQSNGNNLYDVLSICFVYWNHIWRSYKCIDT